MSLPLVKRAIVLTRHSEGLYELPWPESKIIELCFRFAALIVQYKMRCIGGDPLSSTEKPCERCQKAHKT